MYNEILFSDKRIKSENKMGVARRGSGEGLSEIREGD